MPTYVFSQIRPYKLHHLIYWRKYSAYNISPSSLPKQGHIFIVCDFSAIEARVLAWLAKETWRLDAFLRGEDIYCASASQMFGVPVVKHGVNGELRQKGKVAELACGYGDAAGALISMGALDQGLKEDELPGSSSHGA